MDPDRPPDYLPAHHYARQKGCCRSVSSSSPIIAVHIHVYLAFASHRMRLRQDRTWMISAQLSSAQLLRVCWHQGTDHSSSEREREKKRNVRMDEMILVVLIFVGKATGRANSVLVRPEDSLQAKQLQEITAKTTPSKLMEQCLARD
jgi:hypothetical protein